MATKRSGQRTKRPSARRPRPEAQLFRWSELVDDQRFALGSFFELLDGVLEAGDALCRSRVPDADNEHDFLPQIDAMRFSTTVLVDGERGTGKTTVFLNALELLRAQFRNDVAAIDRWLDDDSEDARTTRASLTRLGHRVIPLDILDLAPVPDETELLPWLAQRLYAVAKVPVEPVGRRRRPSSETTGEVDAAWSELIRCVALGWNGNLHARRASLDADAYVFEVERTARRRSEVPRAWREFCDRLVADAQRSFRLGRNQQPVFIVPIDDADLKPALTTKLVTMLRTCWHQRVVFLLTGHTRLFEMALVKEFTDALRPRSVELEPQYRTEPLRLARSTLDKLIPGSSRLTLGFVSGSTALRMLREELSRIPVPSRQGAFDNLAELLDLHPEAQEGLPVHLRQIAETRDWLQGGVSAEAVALRLFSESQRVTSSVETADLVQEIAGGRIFANPAGVARESRGRSQVSIDERRVVSIVDREAFTAQVGRARVDVHPRVFGALMLASDVAALRGTAEPVDTQLHDSGVFVELTSAKSGILRFEWFLPPFSLPLDRDRVRRSIREHVARSDFSLSVLELVEVYVRSSLEVAAREPAERTRTRWAWLPPLLRAATGRRGADYGIPFAMRHWITQQLPLVAAPEFGMPAEDANAFLDAFAASLPTLPTDVGFNLADVRAAATFMRLRSVGASPRDPSQRVSPTDVKAAGLAIAIDEEYPHHRLGSWLRAETARQGSTDLMRILNAIPVVGPVAERGPSSLFQFLPTRGKAATLLENEARISRSSLARLRGLAGVRGTARQAIRNLIASLVDVDPALRELLEIAAGPPTANAQVVGAHDLLIVGVPIPHETNRLPIAHGALSVGRWLEPRAESANRIRDVSNLESTLALLLNDVTADEHDFEIDAGPPVISDIARARIVFDDDTVCHAPWQLPGFRTSYDYWLVSEGWNRALERSLEVAKGATRETQVRIADGLAFLLLSAISEVAFSRRSPLQKEVNVGGAMRVPQLDLALDERDWQLMGQNIHPLRDEKWKGARWDSLRLWFDNAAPLFAAPETGLSGTAAAGLLRAWAPYLKHAEGWASARRRRIEHALRASGDRHPEKRAEGFLDDMRSMFAGHPWYEFVEPIKL